MGKTSDEGADEVTGVSSEELTVEMIVGMVTEAGVAADELGSKVLDDGSELEE